MITKPEIYCVGLWKTRKASGAAAITRHNTILNLSSLQLPNKLIKPQSAEGENPFAEHRVPPAHLLRTPQQKPNTRHMVYRFGSQTGKERESVRQNVGTIF